MFNFLRRTLWWAQFDRIDDKLSQLKKNNNTSQGTRTLIKDKLKLENHLADSHLKVPPLRFGFCIQKKQEDK